MILYFIGIQWVSAAYKQILTIQICSPPEVMTKAFAFGTLAALDSRCIGWRLVEAYVTLIPILVTKVNNLCNYVLGVASQMASKSD